MKLSSGVCIEKLTPKWSFAGAERGGGAAAADWRALGLTPAADGGSVNCSKHSLIREKLSDR